jgi:hypothetical protein
MIRSVIAFLILTLVCPVISNSQIDIRLTDISAHGSPLRTSGFVRFSDDHSSGIRYTYRVDGSVKNLTSKGIMLAVIEIKTKDVDGPPLDYIYENDMFFDSDVIEPGEVIPLNTCPFKSGGSSVSGHPIWGTGPKNTSIPKASARVVFVQFSDGSSWGDAQAAQESLNTRRETLRELRWLENSLWDKDAGELKDELSKKALLLPCIGSLSSKCDGKPNSCLVDGLHDMVEAAKRHELGMKAAEQAALN